MAILRAAELFDLATRALVAAGARREAAEATAAALTATEAQGVTTHGVAMLPLYCAQLRSGRIDPAAVPRIVREQGACVLVDANNALAHEACAMAIDRAMALARDTGIAIGAVTNSNHSGALAAMLAPVAAGSMACLAFSNAGAAIVPPGGRKALFGTNPVAAVFPRRTARGVPRQPVVIDLSLTEATKGRIQELQAAGQPIPEGWGLDSDGQPTTEPDRILFGGSLNAIGGTKGALLAMIVELLVCTLTGAQISKDVEPMQTGRGQPRRLGQLFLLIEPSSLRGALYWQRMETIVETMLGETGVRLPGARRFRALRDAQSVGVKLHDALYLRLVALAGGGAPAAAGDTG